MYFSNFLKDQVFIIKEKGIKILIYKITKLFVLLPVVLVALTLYIFILSLSPILRVRFLSLSFERIGRIYPTFFGKCGQVKTSYQPKKNDRKVRHFRHSTN